MRKLILLVMLFVVFSWGCTILNETTDLTFVSRDESTEYSSKTVLEIDDIVPVNQVDFRSSHVEFWSIKTISDVDGLVSAYYVGTNSAYIDLADTDETFIFRPNEIAQFTKENEISFENKKYNIIRMDIGSGKINFTVNGNIIITDKINQLSCNSIFFIDIEFLTTSIYIDSEEAESIHKGTFTEIDIVDAIILNSNVNNGTIDVDGALFIPFEATDFSEYGFLDSVTVDISWDLNSIVGSSDNGLTYFTENRVEGFPYDFEVTLIVK